MFERFGDLSGKIFFIIGIISGMGFEVVRILFLKGVKVVMLNCNVKKVVDVIIIFKSELGVDIDVLFI